MTDDELDLMVQEAAALGPMTAEEFQKETEAIRAYVVHQAYGPKK